MHQIFDLTEHLQQYQNLDQLFTVYINVKGYTLPGLHILMNGKTDKLYRAVLTAMRSNPGFNPAFAVADFEQAPRNAPSVVFLSVTIIGC